MNEKAEIFLRDKGIIYEWTHIDDKIVIESGDLIKLLADFTESQGKTLPIASVDSQRELLVCDNPHCIDGNVEVIYGEPLRCSKCDQAN